jgi:hypothetical protein
MKHPILNTLNYIMGAKCCTVSHVIYKSTDKKNIITPLPPDGVTLRRPTDETPPGVATHSPQYENQESIQPTAAAN